MPDASPAGTDTRHKFVVEIDAPIEAVWAEITKTDEVIPCFFNTRMHVSSLQAGSRMAMRTADGKYTGVVGEILEVTPPTRFAHTFKFTNFDDPACVVVNELEDLGNGRTRYTMLLRDLPEGTKTAKQMVQGGKLIVNTLKSVMETGRPSFGTRMLFVLFKLMAPLSPKQSRSEHWPV